MEKKQRKSAFRDNFESIIIAGIFALFVRTYVIQAFKIPTASMAENLLIGDHILVNKFVFADDMPKGWFFSPTREIKRGDVVVFKYPNEPETDFIKRVIGLPGDKIFIRGTKVFVNGKEVREDGKEGSWLVYYKNSNPFYHYPQVEVEEDCYFVMGDNRNNSRDSRSWGCVPRENIHGRALVIYWSYETPRNSHYWRGWGDRIKQITGVVINFFNKTRWQRTFKLIR